MQCWEGHREVEALGSPVSPEEAAAARRAARRERATPQCQISSWELGMAALRYSTPSLCQVIVYRKFPVQAGLAIGPLSDIATTWSLHHVQLVFIRITGT